MMVENHYSLNIAYKGDHFARVDFNHLSRDVALQRAKQIAEALRATYGVESHWRFDLSYVECTSRQVTEHPSGWGLVLPEV